MHFMCTLRNVSINVIVNNNLKEKKYYKCKDLMYRGYEEIENVCKQRETEGKA